MYPSSGACDCVVFFYHIGRFVLGSLCVGDLVRLGLSSVGIAGYSTASACNTVTTQTQPQQISLQSRQALCYLNCDVTKLEDCFWF